MNIMVVSPHPDDEVLGAGGTLLRYKSEGHSIAWLIISDIHKEYGWDKRKIEKRKSEIDQVTNFFKFDKIYNLKLPTSRLDTLPVEEIVKKISKVINAFTPNIILIPHHGDVHTDHQIINNAVVSTSKWFRYPFIYKILCYETLSETEFGLNPYHNFYPNVFVDISDFLKKKIKAMEIYSSEIKDFPFPRSKISIESLARLRGSSSGFNAAEAFCLLRERI